MNSSVIASGSFVGNVSLLDFCALEVLLTLENAHSLALLAQGAEIDLFKLILTSSILSKVVLVILLFFSYCLLGYHLQEICRHTQTASPFGNLHSHVP